MPIIHQVEDLQFVCFAVVFGVMAWQSRGEKTIRYVWCSHLLAMAVAGVDAVVAQPLTLLANCAILTILGLRYAVLAAGIASFTGRAEWLGRTCFGLTGVAMCMLGLGRTGMAGRTVLSMYYVVLAAELLLICVILVRPRERAPAVPRWILAGLFLLSAAYRVDQMLFVLSKRTAHDLWWRDQGLFLNSTILGCLLPFTVVWMMNARSHATLLEQSLLDPLTNLLNRRGLAEVAARELARYGRSRRDIAVAVGDLDRFKALNDTYGHGFGDEVLEATARLLRETLRETDVVARTGGEEFVMLLPLTDEGEMIRVLERVRVVLEGKALAAGNGEDVRVTMSIGVTNTRGRVGVSWEELQEEADQALYEAKQGGRNRIVCAAGDAVRVEA
jgi:diguanylate cyclase (GGDEF)-like protein